MDLSTCTCMCNCQFDKLHTYIHACTVRGTEGVREEGRERVREGHNENTGGVGVGGERGRGRVSPNTH